MLRFGLEDSIEFIPLHQASIMPQARFPETN
jgi:hypothetical protein